MHRKAPEDKDSQSTDNSRKTTLKWNSSGELAEEDMARILDKLSNPDLTECELSCDVD